MLNVYCKLKRRQQDKSRSKLAKAGSAKYKSKFQPEWTKEWPCISKGTTPYHFWCNICRKESVCSHQGRLDITRHLMTESHRNKVKTVERTQPISKFMFNAPCRGEMSEIESKVMEIHCATRCNNRSLFYFLFFFYCCALLHNLCFFNFI